MLYTVLPEKTAAVGGAMMGSDHVYEISGVSVEYVIVITQARVLCLIYTHDARGHAAPEGECVYIRQSTSACVITNIFHFRHCQNLPKPDVRCSAALYSNRYWL